MLVYYNTCLISYSELCYLILGFIMIQHITLCNIMLCYVMLYYVISYYIIVYYIILYYIILYYREAARGPRADATSDLFRGWGGWACEYVGRYGLRMWLL